MTQAAPEIGEGGNGEGGIMEPVLGKITVSRTNGYIEGDYITISVVDEHAVIAPIEIKMTIADFGAAITGMGRIPCMFTLQDTDKVGRIREAKPLEFAIPPCSNKKTVAQDIAKRMCPEGWKPALSFNAQQSFFQKDGEWWARTTIYRWRDNP